MWRTFLENHLKSMVSVDFFTVPTIQFQVLYVFLVSRTTGAGFFTSASPPIPPPSGPPNNSVMLSRGTPRHGMCCEIATASSAMTSESR